MVEFTIKQLLENGFHYGHSTRRWNPKVKQYIYGTYNGAHIIDLQKTYPLLKKALEEVTKAVSGGGRVLFVGTKHQSSSIVKEFAEKSGQYYVNHRWLGGMLTNWKTISQSIASLDALDKKIADGLEGYTKKEILNIQREREKLNLVLAGIRNMGALPNLLVVIDSSKDSIAVSEANKLNIPVVSLLDTNCDPDKIDFPVPGNDDAIKSIRLFCSLVAQACLEGLQKEVEKKEKNNKDKATEDKTEEISENKEEVKSEA